MPQVNLNFNLSAAEVKVLKQIQQKRYSRHGSVESALHAIVVDAVKSEIAIQRGRNIVQLRYGKIDGAALEERLVKIGLSADEAKQLISLKNGG